MDIIKNIINKYSNLQLFFRSFFVLMIIFLVFFSVNLIISIKNKPKSAYSALYKEEPKTKLQDTRVHNWSELEKKK